MINQTFYILSEDHEVIPVDSYDQWLAWRQQQGEWPQIAYNAVAPGLEVSTVFLGINTSPSGPPMVFETMSFKNGCEVHQWRYATYDEALTGHAEMIAKLKSDDAG